MSTPPPNAGEAITKDRALEIARQALVELGPDDHFTIYEDRIQEREFGWVFLYDPKAFIETGDMKSLVPGTGPLVVLRAGGATEYLTTSVPPEVAIDEFEQSWRKGEHPGGKAAGNA
jgi:hypothetical protein